MNERSRSMPGSCDTYHGRLSEATKNKGSHIKGKAGGSRVQQRQG